MAALAIGIGGDYGIYLYAHLDSCRQQGLELAEAWRQTLGGTVLLTRLTLVIVPLSSHRHSRASPTALAVVEPYFLVTGLSGAVRLPIIAPASSPEQGRTSVDVGLMVWPFCPLGRKR